MPHVSLDFKTETKIKQAKRPFVSLSVRVAKWRCSIGNVRFLVDTGSNRTVLNKVVWEEICSSHSRLDPKPRPVTAEVPGGRASFLVGPAASLTCLYDGGIDHLKLEVPRIWIDPGGDLPCVLGMDSLEQLSLVYQGPRDKYAAFPDSCWGILGPGAAQEVPRSPLWSPLL